MNIGIDANEANTKIRVGVGQFAYNLICELNRQNQNDNYFVYLKNRPLDDLPPQSANWHYVVCGPKFLWTKFALPLKLLFSPQKLSLFYSPSHYSPFFSPVPTVPTIHDIGYLKYQDQFTKKDLYQLINWTEASIKKAKYIVAVSQFTKNELINTYQISSDKISVIYNGVGDPPKLTNTEKNRVLKKFNITKPYFLSVGTLKPNKNYPFLIEAFSKFLVKHPHHQLVIAGKKGWLFDEINSVIEKLKLSNQVIFTDYISETEKWVLYQNAISLVIPSTYEGFGIPAIECQKMNTPVIASDIPSLREVLSDSAIYINPEKEKSLIFALEKVLDTNFRNQIISKGKTQNLKFSWKASAQSLITLFHQKFASKNV